MASNGCARSRFYTEAKYKDVARGILAKETQTIHLAKLLPPRLCEVSDLEPERNDLPLSSKSNRSDHQST
jgi:hypothetical protein